MKFEKPSPYYTNIEEENCQILVHMLGSVIDNGTGASIRSGYRIQGDFAGKTGTTQDQSDGWFIGMSPNLVAGCWVGADDPGIHFRTINYGQGAYMALPIVGKFFSKIYNDARYSKMKLAKFDQPSNRILSELSIPSYRTELEQEKLGGFFDRLFSRDKEERMEPEEQEQSQDGEPKKIWETIRDIFKKKK